MNTGDYVWNDETDEREFCCVNRCRRLALKKCGVKVGVDEPRKFYYCEPCFRSVCYWIKRIK